MNDKKQYEAFMEELKKLANNFRDVVTELGDILAKILPDVENPEEEEDIWEMEIPYKYGDDYWVILDNGDIDSERWDEYETDGKRFNAGNVFPTKQEAELEAKRKNLLTRFRAFRDECNDGWKPDWRKNEAKYYFYISSTDGEIGINDIYFYETFPLFGYFKNEDDAQRALELFGDEIKELFVDCEGD